MRGAGTQSTAGMPITRAFAVISDWGGTSSAPYTTPGQTAAASVLDTVRIGFVPTTRPIMFLCRSMMSFLGRAHAVQALTRFQLPTYCLIFRGRSSQVISSEDLQFVVSGACHSCHPFPVLASGWGGLVAAARQPVSPHTPEVALGPLSAPSPLQPATTSCRKGSQVRA